MKIVRAREMRIRNRKWSLLSLRRTKTLKEKVAWLLLSKMKDCAGTTNRQSITGTKMANLRFKSNSNQTTLLCKMSCSKL